MHKSLEGIIARETRLPVFAIGFFTVATNFVMRRNRKIDRATLATLS